MAEHIHGSTEALSLYLVQLRTKAEELDRECTRLRAIVSQEIEIVEGLIQKLQPDNSSVRDLMNWRKNLTMLVVASAANLLAPVAPAVAQPNHLPTLLTRDSATICLQVPSLPSKRDVLPHEL